MMTFPPSCSSLHYCCGLAAAAVTHNRIATDENIRHIRIIRVLTDCSVIAPRIVYELSAAGILPTTPSEAVCDRLPLPVPPIPNEQPEIFAIFRRVIGLYINEINKYNAQAACRAQVHATHQEVP